MYSGTRATERRRAMETYVRNIVISCPDARELGTFYAELLGLQVIRTDWFVIARDASSRMRLGFDGEEGYRAPRWGDPERPQQLRLDFPVSSLDAAGELALRLGAASLEDNGDSRIHADPAGHPFCL